MVVTDVVSALTEHRDRLRGIAQDLHAGTLLADAIRKADDNLVWRGQIRTAFVGWIRNLDGWIRNPLAGGVDMVVKALDARLQAIQNAQQAIASGIPGVVAPLPPAPLHYNPGRPPPFDVHGGPVHGENVMNPDEVKHLANMLGKASQDVMDIGRRVNDALAPPPVPPPPPGIPVPPGPPVSPFPPDAAEAAGFPGAYQAVSQALGAAVGDLVKRANAFAAAFGDQTVGPAIDLSGITAAAGAAVQTATDAAAATQAPIPESAAPRSAIEWSPESANAGEGTAKEFGKILARPGFDQGDHADLFAALNEANKHADDPAYATAFVNGLVPDGLRDWCKLMNNSVIDVRLEMDILGPMSRLVGTATQSPDALEPGARDALLKSSCLDTIVHYGKFDTNFALDAAQRILDDPDHYHRSDGSHRVYSAAQEKGPNQTGDARYGALQLLINNPEAAQIMAEGRDGHSRMAVLKALEGDGLVGEAAAAALECGLRDLSRKESVDALELALRMVAHDHLHPKGPGKEALARLLTNEKLAEDLFAHQTIQSDGSDWKVGTQGFNVPRPTLGKALGKILDDEKARSELLRGLSTQAVSLLKQKADMAGNIQLNLGPGAIPDELLNYFHGLGDAGEVFQSVVAGAEDANKKKEPNSFLVAGIDLAISESVKLLPGGVIVAAGATAVVKKGTDYVVGKNEEDRLKHLGADELKQELQNKLRVLAIVGLFSNENLVRQLIPPGSQVAKDLSPKYLDEQGRIKMPPPPTGNGDATEFNNFVRALEKSTGSPISRVVMHAEHWAQSYTPG